MSNVVIIGGSLSGQNIAVGLRENDKDCAITLISEENYPAYDHLRLADFISGIIDEEKIFLCSDEFYKEQNINFIKGKKAGSINTVKKLVYFKDKGSISYDFLIIASGRGPQVPDIAGARKEGAYRIYLLDEAKEFLKRYISAPVCIAGSNSFALKVAEAVTQRYNVEVKLISTKGFDPASVPQNVEVINDSLAEVIGEGEVQAIKLSSGKAIGVSAVLYIDGYKSNVDFLKNTDIQVKDDLIVIDSCMRTSVENIFACGSVVGRDSVAVSAMVVDNVLSDMKVAACRMS
jgi:NAD(P)H-nitrite reductase large subunit